MLVSVWWWLGLLAIAPALMALDVFVVPGGRGPVALRPAVRWTMIWTAVGAGFGIAVWIGWGESYAIKYTTGFLVEKALTIDQVMVFALILTAFRPPDRAAQRAVFLALWLALLLKLPFIAVGALLGANGDQIIRFGLAIGFVVGGVFFMRHRHGEPAVTENRYLRFLARHVDILEEWRGDRFVVHEGGRRRYTLGFALAFALITADVYFSATVPLAFAAQKPPFLVLASSALAEVGLRSLFWLVQALRVDPVLLKWSLAAVLWLVAAELALSDTVHDPTWLLPSAIGVVLAVPIVVSVRRR